MSLLFLCLGLLGLGPASLRFSSEPPPSPAPAAPGGTSQASAGSVSTVSAAAIAGNDGASQYAAASGAQLTTVGAHGTSVLVVGQRERHAAAPTLITMGTPPPRSFSPYPGPGADAVARPLGLGSASVMAGARVSHTPAGTALSIDAYEDTPISFTLPCTDGDGDPLTYATVDMPLDGSISLVGSTATYTPNPNFEGMDTFSWRCEDPSGLSSPPVPADIIVQPVNDAPVAANGTITLNEDDAGAARLSATDVESSGTLTYAIDTGPLHGMVVLAGSTAQYRPNADYAGPDSFTFHANDGTEDSNIATISITVTNLEDTPQATNSAGATTSGVPVSLPAAYIDPDGPDVTVSLESEPEYGTLSLSGTTFVYTPPDDFMGVDTFTYSLTDPTGLVSDTVTLRVNVHPTPTPGRPDMPQFGLNFIQFGLDATPGEPLSTASYNFQPETIFDNFAALGAQAYRQSQSADLVWTSIQPGNSGDFADDESLEVLPNPDFEPIATLFERQYGSPTPPWCTDPGAFQRYMSHEAYAYLDHIIDVFGGDVRYFEIGNEVYHWVASYPPQTEGGLADMPACYATDGYYPSQQAVFLEEASRYLRSGIPDAVITLPAINTSDDTSNDWLREVMAASGDSDWFDVISYHSYNEWTRLYSMRSSLADLISELGLDHKMVKMTEGGSSSDPTRITKTDYPNSDETQCSDVFRLPLISWGYGDAGYIWHSYIVADEDPTLSFAMEVVNFDGSWKPSGYTMQLMTENLLPFSEVADFSYSERYRFRIDRTDGGTRWVMWGDRPAPVPAGVTEYTSVYPNADGTFTWIPVSEGDAVTLSDTPILLR